MSFPQTPLDARVELLLGGSWTQVQASPTGVRGADKIVITRGRADEQQTGSQQPSTAVMSFNNRDGRYSPRNPTSPYYGQLGRNTPIRISTIGDGTTYCRMPGRYGLDYASCPDAAPLHITGDIDVRIDVQLDNVLQYQVLAVKGDWGTFGAFGTPANLGWILYLGGSGQVRFGWSANGTSLANIGHSTANLTASQSGTQLAIRATLAVASGTVTFYTAPNISGSWTQLGAPIVTSATSIFASTSQIQVGEAGNNAVTLNQSIMSGRLNAFQLLNGIGGTAVANPVFNTQALGTTSFNDTAAAPNTWTLNGQVEVTNRRYRFHGEVSSWPQKWDISGKDVWTPIEAAGILRRYGQGSIPVMSPIRRAVTASKSLVPIIYWPCEDPAGSGSFAVGAGSGQPLSISGSPTLATDSHIAGSAPLPTIGSSTWTGSVPSYTLLSQNSFQVVFCVYLNSTPANGVLLRVVCGTTRFDFAYANASQEFYVNAYDTASGNLVGPDNSAGQQAYIVGEVLVWKVAAAQNGANIDYGVFDYKANNGAGVSTTATGRTLGALSQIQVDPNGTFTDTVVGHIAVYNEPKSITTTSFPPHANALTGQAGETAGQRFVRLCLENGVQPRIVGDFFDSPAMGAQAIDTFVNLIQSCVDADGGLLYEPRDVFGIGLYQRSALYSQTSVATLSHSGNQLSAVPEPIDDDQLVRNDVTVTRTGGSFARATLVTGTLSVLDPPNGVGQYPDTPTINFNADTQLLNEASWRLHAQTVDESRWPLVTTAMQSNEMVANPTLAQQVQSADIGNVLTLTGLPAWLPPSDTHQLIQGIVVTMSNYEFGIAFNCSPASPYDTLVLDDTVFGHIDTDGSTLNDATLNTTATSFTVATTGAGTGSPLWTTNAGDMPFDIVMDGEQMTVTNITGASSPQTFTVTRSVNGVAKSHTSGAAVSLQRPIYLSL